MLHCENDFLICNVEHSFKNLCGRTTDQMDEHLCAQSDVLWIELIARLERIVQQAN